MSLIRVRILAFDKMAAITIAPKWFIMASSTINFTGFSATLQIEWTLIFACLVQLKVI